MEVRDGRPLVGEFALDKNGFIFVEHKTKVADFFDAEELKSVYYPEVERVIRESIEARALAFFGT